MNKELKALLAQINSKKAEVKNLANENKLVEAKAAKEELINLQAKFDVLYDLEEENNKANEEGVLDKAKEIGNKAKEVGNAFVNAIKSGLSGKRISDDDIEVLQNSMSGSVPEDGGLTVPQDIATSIKELRRGADALENLVTVEPVTTLSGSRVIEKSADQVPFDNVDEEAEFPDVATPKFEKLSYKVKKKGGILKVTRELLQDSAENILNYLRKWIAKKSKATRNALIVAQIKTMTAGKEVAVTSLDDLKDIFNVTLDPAIALTSGILTNQDGFNWLDKLKDTDGKYVLQVNPANATQRLLFGKYVVTVVSNKTLLTELNKIPFICGDLKEAITLFDREVLSIEMSDVAGDLWGKDLTGIKVRERLDIQPVDEEAIVKAQVTLP